MRIALIGGRDNQQFPTLGYGGIEHCVENLAWGLYERDHNFVCVVPRRKIRKDYPFEIVESPVEPAPGPTVRVWPFAESLPAIVRRLAPDVVWVQGFWAAETLQHLGIPVICSFHDIVMPHEPPDPQWLVPRRNTWYRFVSRAHLAQWMAVAPETIPSRSFFLYTGMAEAEYNFGPPEERKDYYLWVGGLKWGLEAKGLDTVIRLAVTHRSKTFVVHGAGSDLMADELRRLERQVSNLHFAGELPRGEIHARIFKEARLFLMPTRLPEPLGRTNLESMTKGTPVLGTCCGALPELICDGVSGFTTDDLEQMSRFLDYPYDYAACYAYAQRFHVGHEVDALVRISKQLLSCGRLPEDVAAGAVCCGGADPTAAGETAPTRRTSATAPVRDQSYYSQPRWDVAALIDAVPGRDFLDVGCGMGGIGRLLRQGGCGRLCGVEVEPTAAAEAATTYDRVVVGDVETAVLPFAPGSFDTVICADVIEHLKDPWRVLQALYDLLRPGGCLVASIPNLRNADTISGLLMGRFDYQEWGILDRSHLRFFTLDGIRKMFRAAGFAIERIVSNEDANAAKILALWQGTDLLGTMARTAKLLTGANAVLGPSDLRELLVIQFVLRARKPDLTLRGRESDAAGRNR